MRVLVTHAGDAFARALLAALCENPAISAVTAMATRRPGFEHAKLRELEVDPLRGAAAAQLEGHEALVNLACRATHVIADDTVDACVKPVHKLFRAAQEAGVRRMIHVSSAAVYGPVIHASEQAPLHPLPGFRYAQEHAHLETLLAIDFPDCVRLRPHVVVGPGAHPAVRSFLRQPFYPQPDGSQALFQCVHTDDVTRAVILSLEKPAARGAYNLATEESFTLRDAARARHRLAVALSPPTFQRAMDLARRYLRWQIDPAWLERASHTVLLNCRRALTDLGWRPRVRALDAMRLT